MAIGGVVINFTARTKGAVQDVQKFTKELSKVDSAAGKTSSVLKKGLAVGAAAAGAALVGAGAAMVEFAQAAVEDYKSAQKLADTLGTIPGITKEAIAANEEWISSMQIATNVADTDLRQAVAKAALVTQDLGEAQNIAAAAADLAAINGKSYSAVADAMAKAAAGNTTQLKRMAPWLDTNKDGTLEFAEAMKALGDKYSEAAEKAADRDPWERLKTLWGEMKESLGQFVIPLLENLGTWFKDKKNQKALQKWIDKIGDLSTKLGTDLVKAIQDVYAWLGSPDGQANIKTWTDAIKGAAAAIKTLAGWIKTASDAYNKLPAWMRGNILDYVSPSGKYSPLNPKNAPGYGGTGETKPPVLDPSKPTYITKPGTKVVDGKIVQQSSVTVNNYYPKPETASANLAASLRIARLVAP